MISAWHLLWIVPLSVSIGIMMVAVLQGSRDNQD